MSTPTLAAAAEEFKVDPNEIIDFLTRYGFGVNSLHLKMALTTAMYAATEGRFADDLAIRRIKQCLATQNTYLEIGRCSLIDKDFGEGSELDNLLKRCTHLKTLILSNVWWNADEKKWDKSSNNRRYNQFSYLPSTISSCKNLEKLICSGYNDLSFKEWWKIQDIGMLLKLPSLKYIDISCNQIRESKGLEKFAGLQLLYLSRNQISDASYLEKLTSLQSLDLSSNQILDASFLEKLTSLQSLYLSRNQISDVGFLEKLTSLQSLNLSFNQILDYSFLKKLTGLQSLDLSNNKISDYSFLEKLTSLQSLYLSRNQISDTSFLEKLAGLQSLTLSDNQISDVSFLKKLTGLQSLTLRGNQISDASFLEKLTGLQLLNLSNNQISDASFLEKLTGLQSLYLSNNKISDYSFLKKLTGLQSLDLSNNKISDYSFLEKLTSLQSLYLSRNQISDASFLKKLAGLQSLTLSDNQISDVSFLKKLTSLQSLYLSRNQISDASFLEKLTGLQSLYLSNNKISDASFLEKLTGLQSLYLSNNKISEIASLDFIKKMAPFEVFIDDNPFVKKYDLKLELFENHLPSIVALLERLGAQDFTFPLKVLMLGNHGVGKSSVVDSLTGRKSSGSTHILRIENHSLKPTTNIATTVPDMVFFDFGGQDFYHGLYQAFISTGALQLIVFDSRKDENGPGKDSTGNDIFNYNRPYWLGQKAYRERSEASDSYILVQTYADVKEVKEAPLSDHEQYPGYLQSFFLSFPSAEDKDASTFYEAGRAYFKAFFEKEVTAKLKTQVHAKKYAQWYFDFMQYIVNKEGKTHEPVPLTDVLAHYHPDEPDNTKRQALLQTDLVQLHRHGLVMYYWEKNLEDIVWLHPQALVQHVQETVLSKKIITDKSPGIVSKKDFEKLANKKTLKMLLLQKVVFLHQPNKTQPEREEYIIPNYLPIADESDIDYQLFIFGIGTPNFIIKFNDFIPFGFINQMICFFGEQPDAKKFWRNQLLFTLHKEVRVLIQLDFVYLKIKVHFQLLCPMQDDEKLISEYLFFTLLALYWNINAVCIPNYESYSAFKATIANKTEANSQYGLFSQLFIDRETADMVDEMIKKHIPADAYLSTDDERYIYYRDLIALPKKEYRIKSYNLKNGRIDKENVKEIPASLFAAFTIKKLPAMKNVFISYSHNDIQYRQELQTYLVNLERDGLIQIWQDGLIQTGDEWDKKIKENLQNADICIMLLSQSFIVSNYVHEVELKTIMEKRKTDNCRIIPVLIKDCDWKNWKVYPQEILDKMKPQEKNNYKMASFQFLPIEDGRLKPINKWQHPEEAWLSVADAIRDFCKEN